MGRRFVTVFPWIMCIRQFQMAERALRNPVRKAWKQTLSESWFKVPVQHRLKRRVCCDMQLLLTVLCMVYSRMPVRIWKILKVNTARY